MKTKHAVFLPHANIQYSQLPPERRRWVIENSYERLFDLVAEGGYRIGFGGRHGPADLDCDPIDLPRIEIRGDRSLDHFVASVEAVLK